MTAKNANVITSVPKKKKKKPQTSRTKSRPIIVPAGMKTKNVAVRYPDEAFFSLPTEVVNGQDLSRLTAEDAGRVLGVKAERITTVLPYGQESGKPIFDIRLVNSVRQGKIRTDADPIAYAVAGLQWDLLAGGKQLDPEEIADTRYTLTTNVFRHPRHLEPLFRSRAAAEKILGKMVYQLFLAMPSNEPSAGYKHSLTVCYASPAHLPQRTKNASKNNAVLQTISQHPSYVTALSFDIHVGYAAKGRTPESVRDEILYVITKGKNSPSNFADVSSDRVFTDDVLKRLTPPDGFERRLIEEFDADPDIGEWFDPERIGRGKRVFRYWRIFKEDASAIFPLAEYLEEPALQALIALFADPVSFLSKYGTVMRPVDPHGQLPKQYAVVDAVWLEWTAAVCQPVLRDKTWVRPVGPQTVFRLFNVQAGVFRRGGKSEIYAKKSDGTWMTGKELVTFRWACVSLGFHLKTGRLFVAGRPSSPDLIFKDLARGQLDDVPEAVRIYRNKKSSVAENRRKRNQKNSARRMERRKASVDGSVKDARSADKTVHTVSNPDQKSESGVEVVKEGGK